MNIMAHRLEAGQFHTIEAKGHLIHYDNNAAGWRYATLLDKEPETIEWIDSFEPGDTLWDIGANVGIYSVYAGVKGIRTLAFEPHFANYQQLCCSIALNGLQDLVTPLCLAFDNRKSIGELNLASLDVGTSMSNFGAALDFRGQPFVPAFRQGMIGYDIDSFIADFGLAIPTHLKIDVDGIELAIVQGAQALLANETLQSVSIELIESDLDQVASVTALLEGAGLQFVHKKQNAHFATPQTADVKNFLFHRDPAKLLRATTPGADAGPDEDDEALVTVDQIVERIVSRIEAAPVDGDPCDHLVMEGLFASNVYRELLARLPQDSALEPIAHPDAVDSDGRVTRYLLDLTRNSLARLDPDDQQFWQAMIEVFTAPAIARAVVAKFEDKLRDRFGDDMPELIAVPLLYRDFPGYRIGIHPDAASKVATLQFYLPADETQAHLGTVFHRKGAAGFERVKTNNFHPNSAYAFVRTEESWHSVDEIGPHEAPRNTIALTFYIKGQEYRSAPMADMNSIAPQPAAVAPTPSHILNDVYDASMSEALRVLAATFTRRDDVATLFLEGGTGVELGVAGGDFSERILKRSKVGYLYSIDMWAGDRGHDMDQYRETIVRLAPYRDRNAIWRMRFEDALPLFADHSLDYVYVDGYAHDGELNGATFRDWFPKLKRGGFIAGDDYHADWPLVVAAVDRFAADVGLELHVIRCGEVDTWNSKYPTWFAMKP
ncbi:class I SAM-dependent methyltransferase [Sphingobium nicotianae]|uniref:FkbM family methyltransferase n=1 Tax=Sphingobium nicotianae TaxID=2782607 RepID=A0A9X1DER5_9SPHN|nr:FkbM family methyltransferase [Sphingobium nicotianae]MBT2188572.1 FkbM family methyltransferase [Sphingobium nicotianae]